MVHNALFSLPQASEELVCSTRGFRLDDKYLNQRVAEEDCEASIAWLIEQSLCNALEKVNTADFVKICKLMFHLSFPNVPYAIPVNGCCTFPSR
jgi:hypothetical protein